jgi:hypothetical protein
VKSRPSTTTDIHDRLAHELEESERRAWDSLAKYKFQMFGYWAAIWVHLNRVGGFRHPNPFKKKLVQAARDEQAVRASVKRHRS